MRKGLLGSVAVLLTGGGLALAQAPTAQPTSSPPAPMLLPVAAAPDAGAADGAIGEDIHEPSRPAPGRFYADADYLFWFSRPQKLPPLVVATAASDTAVNPAAGTPGTVILIGNKSIDSAARSGMRLRAGAWLNAEETVGLEGSGFFLEQASSNFSVTSNPSALFGLAFQDASVLALPTETSLLFAAPDVAAAALVNATGSSQLHTSTKFWGAELNAMANVAGCSWYRAEALVGFRYLRLQEDLSMTTTSNTTPDGFVEFQGNFFVDPARVMIADAFRTANDFYGGQVGAHVLLQKGDWFADFRGMLAAGVTHQTLTVNGSTSLTTPDGTITVPGGLYAQPTNMGHFAKNVFTTVPEAGFSVGCQLTSFLRVSVGYSAIYWRQGVLRPASEIDRFVNTTALPVQNPMPLGTETHPASQLQRVDFWAQGAHFGAEIDF